MIEIKVNAGAWQNVETLGLQVSELSRRNMAVDEVTLTKVIGDSSERLGIGHNNTVTIRIDGVNIMQGLAQAPTRQFGAGNASRSVRILGGWHHLSRVLFHRSISLNGITGGVFDGALVQGSRITGFSGLKLWIDGAFVDATPGEEYEFTNRVDWASTPKKVDISGYVTTAGALFPRFKIGSSVVLTSLFSQVYQSLLIWRAGFLAFTKQPPLIIPDGDELNKALNVPYTVFPRQQNIADVTCDRVLQNMLTIVPRCSTWVDYATETPELHLTPLEDMPVSEITPSLIVDGNLSVRHDLVPKGVVVQYEKPKPTGDALMLARGHADKLRVDKWPLTIQTNMPEIITLTVPHPGEVEPVALNLARSVYEQLTPARLAGVVVLGPLDAVRASQWRPGRAIAVSADPELEGYTGIIQEAVWNPASHTVRLSVGYPQPAAISTLRDLQSYLIESLSGKF